MHPNRRNNADRYRQTMDDMRTELPPHLSTASRVIHHPLVEGILAVFDALLRPRALILAAVFACFATIGSYLLTVLHNFTPSGSESLTMCIGGWIIGLMIDGFIRISRPNSHLS